MKTTITDVAKQAGVSMKTVSRVLNNEPNVAQTTREKVKAAARALNYSPNLAARGLASSRSFFLALLYDNPSPSYLTRLQRGAVEACREYGYHLILQPMNMGTEDPFETEFMLARLGVDGVILAPPLSENKSLRDALDKLNIRVSLISAQAGPNAYTVGMDESAAAQTMTEHLITLGHRHIGFVKGPEHHQASHLRFQGFKTAMARHGLEVPDDCLRQGDFTLESGVRAGRDLLAQSRRPTAIFASNDDMAAGVMNAARAASFDVPQDVSVCGFDNTQIAEMVWPALTTIAQPIRQMGVRAAKSLIDHGKSSHSTEFLDFDLIVRSSTAECPVRS